MSSLAFENSTPEKSLRLAPGSSLPKKWPEAKFWGVVLIWINVACWAASPAIGFEGALSITTVVGFVAAIIGIGRPALGLLGMAMLCALEPMASVFLQKGGWLRW